MGYIVDSVTQERLAREAAAKERADHSALLHRVAAAIERQNAVMDEISAFLKAAPKSSDQR